VRQYIASGIKLVVQLARLKGGARRVSRISEIVGAVEGNYEVQDIFGFEQTGLDEHGLARGCFYATGYRPRCLERLRASGVDLPDQLFQERRIAV
jgi:pilus assembly protein CpaF